MSGFRLSKKPLRVWWPVKIDIPIDGGKTKTQKIRLHFEMVGVDEFQEAFPNAGPESWATTDSDDNKALHFLKSKIKGWAGIQGETGDKELKFTPANMTALLDIPYVVGPVQRAYMACVTGRKAKN